MGNSIFNEFYLFEISLKISFDIPIVLKIPFFEFRLLLGHIALYLLFVTMECFIGKHFKKYLSINLKKDFVYLTLSVIETNSMYEKIVCGIFVLVAGDFTKRILLEGEAPKEFFYFEGSYGFSACIFKTSAWVGGTFLLVFVVLHAFLQLV